MNTCRHGHPMTPENTYRYPGKLRAPVCRVCHLNSKRRREAAIRSELRELRAKANAVAAE